MRASDSWDQFQGMIDKAFPRRTSLKDLPLFNQPVETSAPRLPSEPTRNAVPA
jgi:hypothetical protein